MIRFSILNLSLDPNQSETLVKMHFQMYDHPSDAVGQKEIWYLNTAKDKKNKLKTENGRVNQR